MIRANKELDLLRSYRRLMRGEKGRSGLLHHFLTPAAGCLLVCVLIWGVLLLMNSSLSSLTDDVNDWLLDPAVTQQYSEAADRQQYNDSLVQALGQVQALTGYDADTGALRFDAQSTSVIDIPGYVLKLQSLTLTERDKKLLGLTACLAILAVFGVHLIRPALAEHEALGGEYEAALQKQQEYQAQIDARAALDDSIAQNEAALKTAGEPYYPDGLETRQMDDIITGLALKNGLFPQSLTLTEAVPGAVRAYLAVQEQADGSAAPAEGADQTGEASDAPQTDGSASPAEGADQTGEAADAPQTGGGVYIGTATLSAQGDVSQWLHFLDEVERSCKGLRVTNFSISDYDYVENNTQAVSTSLITGTLEIYLCGSGREADA